MNHQFQLASSDASPPSPWSYWIIEGQLLAGCYPGAPTEAEQTAKLSVLLDAGVSTFINLMEPDETSRDGRPFTPYNDHAMRLAPTRELRFVRHAIRDKNIPPNNPFVTPVLDDIDASLAEDRPVYVHCWGGVGRTGTIIACWLLRHGLANKQNVIERLDHLRKQDRQRGHRPSPEEPEQTAFVLAWNE